MSNLLTENKLNFDNLTDFINALNAARNIRVIPFTAKQEIMNNYKQLIIVSSTYPFKKDDSGSNVILKLLEQGLIMLYVLRKRHNMKVNNIIQDTIALISKAQNAIN